MSINVLGINDGHPSSICLIRDGKVLYAAMEERFDRIKNSVNFPILSIKNCLSYTNTKPEEIDLIAFSSKDIDPIDLNKLAENKQDTRLTVLSFSYISSFLPISAVDKLCIVGSKIRSLIKMKRYFFEYKKQLEKLGLKNAKVIFYDHHTVHAATAYYFKQEKPKKVLIFTCDGEGDGLCATVCIGEKNEIKREVEIPFFHSIGKMYNEVTWYLGLKPWEHEYKVMGLAPYSDEKHAKKTWDVFKDMVSIDKKDKRKFRNNTHKWAHTYGLLLKKKLYKHRFDSIAYSIQRLTEEVLTEWVKNNIEYYGINDIMLSGGVFMNVKANQKIMDMPCVNSIFVVPSCGDESSAIGAAMLGYIDICKENGVNPDFKEVKDLYLGPDFNNIIENSLKKLSKIKYKIEYYDEIEDKIATIIKSGGIVARFSDRMEFGARALGNRSILANPSDLRVIREINRQIKQRDFWMPFAPVILRERAKDYIIKRKDCNDQYMILSFKSTPLAQKELISTLHPFDLTCRPQVLDKDWNFSYYNIIKSFEDITGIGALLNTSFNLHGEPIVCTPKDAISTLERSGLKYLSIGNYLIIKK
ncbi:MAG: carbamoyltransferase C-terminal domain-containing protein [Candidatus Aenigmatarchaeota archaeon]